VRKVINTISGSISLGVPDEDVNSIAGGFGGGGYSNSARKKHLRTIQLAHVKCRQTRPRIPPITFTDDDFTAIDVAQDDHKVIT